MRRILRSHWLSLASLAGLIAAVVVSLRAVPRVVEAEIPAIAPSALPYADVIAGSGIVESSQRDVLVAAPSAGVVADVSVKVGDHVARGDVLFTLDRRLTSADVTTRRAAREAARIKRREQQASADQATEQLRIAESVSDPRAVSADELVQRRASAAIAHARVLAAEAEILSRDAELAAARATDELRVVRAPRDGDVLQVGVRPGEYTMGGSGEIPVRLGGIDRLQVRVDVDENDAWRFVPGGRARLILRGNAALQTDLRFEYVEPYVKPKTSLTGSSSERVDTRVLQVVFSFPAHALPIYVGQQVDVVIEVPAAPARTATGAR